MLELPECHTVAEQMDARLAGRTIVSVSAAASPHRFAFFNNDPEDYPGLLKGRILERAYPLARLVELALGAMRLTFGDGANLRWHAAGETPPAKHQLLLRFDDGSCLSCTIQMYGSIFAFRDGECDDFYYRAAKEKPSPLSAEFSERYWESLLSDASPKLSAKAFLATEQRIPGLGNGVLQDLLFKAHIHPKTKLHALSDRELQMLFHCVKDTLSDMTVKGGRDTEKDLFGQNGGYQTLLSAKTLTAPCPVCLGAVIRQAYLGGNVYFCPRCQVWKER